MSLLFDFLPGKKNSKNPGHTGYSCILGSGKQITLPGKYQPSGEMGKGGVR